MIIIFCCTTTGVLVVVVWSLESGRPELANCSEARRPLIMSHMCVWLAGWLGWLADWLAFFVLFFSFFFFIFSSVCNQSLSPQKHKSRKNSTQNFAPFSSKGFFTRGREKEIATVVLGGSSAGPELRENVCLPTNKQTNGDGASVRTGQEWSL